MNVNSLRLCAGRMPGFSRRNRRSGDCLTRSLLSPCTPSCLVPSRTRTHTSTLTHSNTHTHSNTPTRTHTHIHSNTHTHTRTHTHICTHTHLHTHTHTHTLNHSSISSGIVLFVSDFSRQNMSETFQRCPSVHTVFSVSIPPQNSQNPSFLCQVSASLFV